MTKRVRKSKKVETQVSVRGVIIPLDAIIAAFPKAIAACKESAADNKDASSPGGAKVTVGEVLEDASEFFETLLEEAAPAIMKANGL